MVDESVSVELTLEIFDEPFILIPRSINCVNMILSSWLFEQVLIEIDVYFGGLILAYVHFSFEFHYENDRISKIIIHVYLTISIELVQ